MLNIKNKIKEDSFERYARAIQNDIAQLGKNMEAGFKSIQEEMTTHATHAALMDVRDDAQRLNAVMVTKGELAEVVRRELEMASYAKESKVKELDKRVCRVEKKLEIEPR